MKPSESRLDHCAARRTLSSHDSEGEDQFSPQYDHEITRTREPDHHQANDSIRTSPTATVIATRSHMHIRARVKRYIGIIVVMSGLSLLAVLHQTKYLIPSDPTPMKNLAISQGDEIDEASRSSKHLRALVRDLVTIQDDSRSADVEPPMRPQVTASNNDPGTEFTSNNKNSSSRAKGIIIGIYNDIVSLGLSLIKDLRCLGNHELVQVYHCLPTELSPASKRLLLDSDDNLEIIDVCSDLVQRGLLPMDVAVRFHNWWIKPLAMYHTDLEQVLLLDADAVLLQDPAVVRKTTGYTRTGTMFFYDRVINKIMHFNAQIRTTSQNGRKQALRLLLDSFDYKFFNLTGPNASGHLLNSLAYDGRTCHEQDSSMVAIDKTRSNVERAMQVLLYLITKTRFELEFSWGDKESFWLAYELAQVEYAFSPWGVSVLSSTGANDMINHPDTLCGNMAHFVPDETQDPELLYVNGRALLDPFPVGRTVQETQRHSAHLLFNMHPTHVTPRQIRRGTDRRNYMSGRTLLPQECLIGMGSTPLSPEFRRHLLRRRVFFLGLELGLTSQLHRCDLEE